MDLSAMKDLYIGSTPVQSAWLGGTKVWERTPAVDIQAIKDAMLLWYDLKRQGATNESMAATPELVNLAYDPDKAHVIDWSEFSTNPGTEAYSITVQSNSYYWLVAQADWHKTHEIPSYYVQVENLPEGAVIYYFYGDGSDERQSYAITYNGLHKLPAGKISPNVNTGTGIFISNENGQTVADVVGTTITQVNPSLNATCYNFAWSGMSGIGGYNIDYTTGHVIYDNRGTLTRNSTTINITNVVNSSNLIETSASNIVTVPSYKIKVTGVPENAILSYKYYIDENETLYRMTEDGEYTLPASTYEHAYVGFQVRNFTGDCNIVIEQIPDYPNALVSDGVDDYVRVEDLPLLDDYTVIVKRKILEADLNKRFTIASKMKDDDSNDGAFLFEWSGLGNGYQVMSFGTFNIISLVDTDTSYMTKNSYNGATIISGRLPDNNHLTLFSTRESSGCASAALYSFILFNRTLTEEEINWVKANLIEGDTEL